jgi:osmotically inducible protein OsmC
MKRTASIVWKGPGKTGNGTITTQSKAMNQVPYAYNTRFEETPGTNPEELIAAAHASCFSMKLSFVLGEKGFTPDSIQTTSEVTLEAGTITESKLTVNAAVPNITEEQFQECAKFAKENCPVSKALSIKISMEATLSKSMVGQQ